MRKKFKKQQQSAAAKIHISIPGKQVKLIYYYYFFCKCVKKPAFQFVDANVAEGWHCLENIYKLIK